jgi:hypothetical protein
MRALYRLNETIHLNICGGIGWQYFDFCILPPWTSPQTSAPEHPPPPPPPPQRDYINPAPEHRVDCLHSSPKHPPPAVQRYSIETAPKYSPPPNINCKTAPEAAAITMTPLSSPKHPPPLPLPEINPPAPKAALDTPAPPKAAALILTNVLHPNAPAVRALPKRKNPRKINANPVVKCVVHLHISRASERLMILRMIFSWKKLMFP